MPSNVSVQVLGESALVAQLRRLSPAAAGRLRNVINRAALAVQLRAKKLCPVDTGRLRSSIAVRFYQGGFGAEVGTNVEYAPHVEFGTRNGRAQPFMGPAWDEVSGTFERDVKAALNEAMGDL